MRDSTSRRVGPVLRALTVAAVLVLTACTPEQTPASAARTAAALRTPVAVPTGQSAVSARPTLAGGGQPASATPQPQTGTQAKPAPETTTVPTPGAVSLTASPNPVVFGVDQLDGVGTSTISWSTGTADLGQVFVSQDGQPEKLFVEGSDASAKANWIRPGSSYEFHLYVGREHRQQLASVTVTTAPVNASTDSELTAEPNPVPADDEELGTTLITWTTGDSQGGEVWVSEDGGPEQLFVNGSQGSGEANWICRDRIYEFHLYGGSGRAKLLNTLTVTRAADAPGSEPPPPVQCQP